MESYRVCHLFLVYVTERSRGPLSCSGKAEEHSIMRTDHVSISSRVLLDTWAVSPSRLPWTALP